MTEQEYIDRGYMEVFARVLSDKEYKFDHKTLLNCISESQIRTFGWSIAAVLPGDHSPVPSEDGIMCKIFVNGLYEYWTLKMNGDFYFLGTYFEDPPITPSPKVMYYDTRINRVAETVMRIGLLYQCLGIPNDLIVEFKIRHTGLKDRVLSVANKARFMISEFVCKGADKAETESKMTIESMNALGSLQETVYKTIKELMILFNFFEPSRDDVYKTVEKFTQGRVT